MKHKLPIVLCVLSLLFCGCGKEKPAPTTQPPEPPADMLFQLVDEPVTAKEEVNLRNYPGQGEESTVLFTLLNGQEALRTGISDSGWSRLEYQDTVCYAVSSFLTTDLSYTPPAQTQDDGIETVFTPAEGTVTAKDEVNLRALPSTTHPDAQILNKLKNGDVARLLGTSDNGWSKLEYEEQICYAVSSYLTTDLHYTPTTSTPAYLEETGIGTVFEDAEGTVTARDMVNLRSIPSSTNPDSQIVGQLRNGEEAQRLGTSRSGWTKLDWNGTVCYAASHLLTTDLDGSQSADTDGDGIRTTFQDVNEKVTAKDAVNLRTLPSTTHPDSKVVKKLKNGEIVTRTGINPDVGWSRVEFEGQTLYCISNYLKLSDLQ